MDIFMLFFKPNFELKFFEKKVIFQGLTEKQSEKCEFLNRSKMNKPDHYI